MRMAKKADNPQPFTQAEAVAKVRMAKEAETAELLARLERDHAAEVFRVYVLGFRV